MVIYMHESEDGVVIIFRYVIFMYGVQYISDNVRVHTHTYNMFTFLYNFI